MAEVEIVDNPAAYREILSDPHLRDQMLESVRPRVRLAQALAPKRTGQGAASIHPEAVLDGDEWEIKVSWTQDHYYMRFHEEGDRYMPPHPFLVPAFE